MKKAGTREAFLIAYRATGNVSESCRQAKVNRDTVYQWRREEPEFALAWDDAKEVAIDLLEEMARKRALDSSDTLMIFLLKANRPEKYRDTYRVEFGNTDDQALVERAASLADRVREMLSGNGAALALPVATEDRGADAEMERTDPVLSPPPAGEAATLPRS